MDRPQDNDEAPAYNQHNPAGKQDPDGEPTGVPSDISSSPTHGLLDTDVPVSAPSESSALEFRPPRIPSRCRRTSPPPHYNPYPYTRSWRLERWIVGAEQHIWHHREDQWTRYSTGLWNIDLRARIWSRLIAIIRDKQSEAKKEWEEEQLRAKAPSTVPLSVSLPPETPPPETEHLSAEPEELVDRQFDVEFMTVDQQKGFPVKTLMSGRRAIERRMDSAKGKVFENYHQDNIWVRIKWPAYPDHEPARSILVTFRRPGKTCKRRPCTRLELSVALASLITRYYDEVSAMDPHPAFTHLALGAGEGRISLYALRLTGLRASQNGTFDLELQLEPAKEEEPDPAPVEGPSEVRFFEPPWPSILPVMCTVGPPPKLTPDQYFTHVDPFAMSRHALPVWQPEQ